MAGEEYGRSDAALKRDFATPHGAPGDQRFATEILTRKYGYATRIVTLNLGLTNDPTLDLIMVVALAVMVAIYFLPTMVAYFRHGSPPQPGARAYRAEPAPP